jgi:uncharacterized protein YndB with AHSA1/START domain
MQTNTLSVVIQCPVEEVFAFVTDARNNPLWQSSGGLRETRQLPDGPVGVGTRITEVWHFMGRDSETTSEVTEYQPNQKYTRRTIEGSSPILSGDFLFEPVAEGTRWTAIVNVKAGGLFAIAEPLLASTLKRGFENSMNEAKVLLEKRYAETPRETPDTHIAIASASASGHVVTRSRGHRAYPPDWRRWH